MPSSLVEPTDSEIEAAAAFASPSEASARPPLWLEQRAALELAELISSPVYYGIGVPRGDGTPVIPVPGFLGSDDYLVILHGWLLRIGYRPRGSRLHCVGSIDALATRLERRVEGVVAESDRRVVLIGHSLGGMLSCRVALRRPDLVEQVVTLGSARSSDARDASDPMVRALADALLRRHASDATWAQEMDWLGLPMPEQVRLTCIYSRDDAVVHWPACLDADPRTDMREVRGSHTGLAWNAAVYRELGRLLAAG
jgi:pimeloyl-ACP methyl ester carboxylesterase